MEKVYIMNSNLESFKLEFARGLQDCDYTFLYDYERIEDCVIIIKIRDLLPSKMKFKFFKFKGNEQIFIQADKRFLIEYKIQQNGIRFELYELTLSKYNEFERKLSEIEL
jgi:hypothetical protein